MRTLGRFVSAAATGLRVHVRRMLRRRDLEVAWIRPTLRGSRFVLVLVVRDEAVRLEHLMNHYRTLGVDHVLVIDNESDDGLEDELRAQDDVSVVRAHGPFKRAHFGIDWVNAVLSRWCRGKWVVHVDADEYLVYDGDGAATLPQLCASLDAAGRHSLQAVMVDMYSDRPASENIVVRGQHPLDTTPLFDASGYHFSYDPRIDGMWIKGGVRGRTFFADSPRAGPALNKTPLVRWRYHYAFVQCAHELWPPALNGGRRRPALGLLHFKFTSTAVAKVLDERMRQQHSQEYDAYRGADAVVLVSEVSQRFRDAGDLVQAGIITTPLR